MNKLLNFGKRLAECRQNKGFSQDELANRLGVTPQAVSKWERSQSIPDIALLTDICTLLGISSDYLLGMQEATITENGDEVEQNLILHNLKHCLEPLMLLIGANLVPLFLENTTYVEQIRNIRRGFSEQGILVPLVRIKDHNSIGNNSFRILAYHKVLYEEELQDISQESMTHIMCMLSETIRNQYSQILNPDLVKKLVDNLRTEYPATINGVVPEKISYNLLTSVLRKIMLHGNAMLYLVKIIEYIEMILREEPRKNSEELAKEVLALIE